jgi:hypothetical protein
MDGGSQRLPVFDPIQATIHNLLTPRGNLTICVYHLTSSHLRPIFVYKLCAFANAAGSERQDWRPSMNQVPDMNTWNFRKSFKKSGKLFMSGKGADTESRFCSLVHRL